MSADYHSEFSLKDLELSVIVVAHNAFDFLPAALRAIEDNTVCAATEIIVVDSASTDGSADNLTGTRFPIRVIHCRDNVGFCRGNNLGVAAARGRLIAFTQPDGEVQPHWDMALRAALDDPEIAVAGGIVMKMREDVIDSAGIAIGPNLAAWSLEEYCLPSDVGLLPGFRREVVGVSPAFLMVRRADHLRVGGFWEDLWAYGDEGDYALRMRRLGKAVVCADSTERHWVGGSTGEHQSPLRLYLSSRNRLLNIARHLPNTHLLQGIVLAAGFDILQILQQRNHAATGAVIRGWLAGARGFLRARARGSTDERCEDLKHIASLRAAIAQQRALGRLSI